MNCPSDDPANESECDERGIGRLLPKSPALPELHPPQLKPSVCHGVSNSLCHSNCTPEPLKSSRNLRGRRAPHVWAQGVFVCGTAEDQQNTWTGGGATGVTTASWIHATAPNRLFQPGRMQLSKFLEIQKVLIEMPTDTTSALELDPATLVASP
jgi:hypothetical protein